MKTFVTLSSAAAAVALMTAAAVTPAAAAALDNIIDYHNETDDILVTVTADADDTAWTIRNSTFRSLYVTYAEGATSSGLIVDISNVRCANGNPSFWTPCVNFVQPETSTVKRHRVAIRNIGAGGSLFNAAFSGSVESTAFSLFDAQGISAVSGAGSPPVSFAVHKTATVVGDGNSFTVSNVSGHNNDDAAASLVGFYSMLVRKTNGADAPEAFHFSAAHISNEKPVDSPSLNVYIHVDASRGGRYEVSHLRDVTVAITGFEGSVLEAATVDISDITATVPTPANPNRVYGDAAVAIRTTLDDGCRASIRRVTLAPNSGRGSIAVGARAEPHTLRKGSELNITDVSGGSGITSHLEVVFESHLRIERTSKVAMITVNHTTISHQSSVTVVDNKDCGGITVREASLGWPRTNDTARASALYIRDNTLVARNGTTDTPAIQIVNIETTNGFVEVAKNKVFSEANTADEPEEQRHFVHGRLLMKGVSGFGHIADLGNALQPSVELSDFGGSYEVWGANFVAPAVAVGVTTTTIDVSVAKKVPARLLFSGQLSRSVVVSGDFSSSAVTREALTAAVQFACANVSTFDTATNASEPIAEPTAACAPGNALVRCTEGFWFYNAAHANRTEDVTRADGAESCTEAQRRFVPTTTTATTTSEPTSAPETETETETETTDVAPTDTPTDGPNTTAAPDDDGEKDSSGRTIAIVCGVIGGVAVVAAGSFFFHRRFLRRKAYDSVEDSSLIGGRVNH